MDAKERKSLKLISLRIKAHSEIMINQLRDETGLSQSDIVRTCLIIQLPKMLKQYGISRSDGD